MKNSVYNIIIEKGLDGYLISSVIELPGCHSQAKTLDSLMKRMKEAISLYVDKNGIKDKYFKFTGLQQISMI